MYGVDIPVINDNIFYLLIFLSGLWNVPYMSNVLLIQGQLLSTLKDAYTHNRNIDPDMSFCEKARQEVKNSMLEIIFIECAFNTGVIFRRHIIAGKKLCLFYKNILYHVFLISRFIS